MTGRAPRRSQYVAVYEIFNVELREIYVGFTDESLDTFRVCLTEKLPGILRHWHGGHHLLFRCVEREVSTAAVEDFIGRYARSAIDDGMRTFWQGMWGLK